MSTDGSMRKRFKKTLAKLFRVEESNLDFGIYRLMNIKRQEINEFIEKNLLEIIEAEKSLFKSLLDDESLETLEDSALQHLVRFFSRYYDEGDFISQRRYGKHHRYVVPYDGEETFFHWVNADQYYIKSSEQLMNYKFHVDDEFTVTFHVVHAVIGKGNVKAPEKMFFLLSDPHFNLHEKGIDFYFEYRPLTKDDLRNLGLKERERLLYQKILERIHEQLETELASISNDFVQKLLQNVSKKDERTLLLSHLSRFFRKSGTDYFIHKNLKDFLLRELDFYLKSEVLDVDSLINMDALYSEVPSLMPEQVFLARLIKKVALPIIEFLHQVENFQKKLWEKKKFVIEAHYVISLNRLHELVGDGFLQEIVHEVMKNELQLREWKELLGENVSTMADLKHEANDKWKPLPLDTRYFSQAFKLKLLTKISENLVDGTSLDDCLDGLLIKSENWQGLNFLLPRYHEQVKLIYIDPPFNKEQEADYPYKVKYKDATWLTLLENRLHLARELLSREGSIFVRCDYNGNMYVRLLLNRIFGKANFRNEIIVKRGSPKAGLFRQFDSVKSIGVMYDNLYWYSKHPETSYHGFIKRLPQKREGYWSSFKKIYDRPTMRYELLGIKLEKGQWMWKEDRARRAVVNYQQYLEEAKKTGETLEEYARRTGISEFVRRVGNTIQYWVSPKEEVMLDNNWLDIPGYSSTWSFKTENSEVLLQRVIEAITAPGEIVMDFFLGSGTTIAVAHKLQRKWIGIEMGEHFWDVILPRMKKVLYRDKSGISRDPRVKKIYNENISGGFFKYLILEQYEDSLENVTFSKEVTKEMKSSVADYTIKYMLVRESKMSASFLNVEWLKNPFKYKLRVMEGGIIGQRNVDAIETFNYLLGIKVEKIRAISFSEIQEDQWIVVVGRTRDEKRACMIWRPWHDDMDFKKDAELIKKVKNDFNPDIVYVNGDCAVQDVRSIDPTFKALMFSEVT